MRVAPLQSAKALAGNMSNLSHFKSVDKYEACYDMVMVIETLGFNLQTLAVKWLREEGETTAADWFQQNWTGPRNGRWMLANTSYGNVTNNNCLESWWK